MHRKSLIIAALTAAAALVLSAAPSYAAPVLTSNVDDAVFTNAVGSIAGWAHVPGGITAPFSGAGTGELQVRSSSFNNSFGYSRINHTGMTTVFGTGAAEGSTSGVVGYEPGYLFYFRSTGGISFIDNVTQFTDGTNNGSILSFQGDIEIFKNAATNTWAFFFDDGGPSLLGDDNDYNDLIVTFSQYVAPVPEPATLSLLGLSLLGLGFIRRRKSTAPGSLKA